MSRPTSSRHEHLAMRQPAGETTMSLIAEPSPSPTFKRGDPVRWRGRGRHNAGLHTTVLEVHSSGRYLRIKRCGRNGHGNRTICDKWVAVESIYRDPRLEREGGSEAR